MVKPPVGQRIRRRYANARYPLVALKFEDGHEIRLKKGQSKTFDAFAGETIKVVVHWDPSADEREVVESKKAEQFEAAE